MTAKKSERLIVKFITNQASKDEIEELTEWLKEDDDHVWFERFLYEKKDLYPQFISEMRDKYPKFSELLKKAKKIQENKLVDGTLKHSLNPTMAIFVLKNHYSYKIK